MPANIAIVDGTAQAWYAGKPAWHGLGVVTPNTKTAKQVRQQIPVFRKPVQLVGVAIEIGGRWVRQPDFRATVRTGSTQAMSTGLTEDYSLFLDDQGLDLMQEIANASRRAAFASAGALGKRAERSFASLDLSRVLNLRIKKDPSNYESYLFGTWSHDGTSAVQFGLAGQRTDCQNMLNAHLARAEARGLLVSIRHTGDLTGRVQEAQRVLGFVEVEAKRFVKVMNDLADIPLPSPTAKWLASFGERLIPIPEGAERTRTRIEARDLITTLYKRSPNLQQVPESPYRVLQAVAEYADHHRSLRAGTKTQEQISESRFRSILEGPAADLKSTAMELLRQEFLVPVSAN